MIATWPRGRPQLAAPDDRSVPARDDEMHSVRRPRDEDILRFLDYCDGMAPPERSAVR